MKSLIILAFMAAFSLQIQLTCNIKIKKLIRNQMAKKARQAFNNRIASNTAKKLKKKDTFTTRVKHHLKQNQGLIFKDVKGNYNSFVYSTPIERTPEEFLKFKGIRKIKAEMFGRRAVRKEKRESKKYSQIIYEEKSKLNEIADSGDENQNEESLEQQNENEQSENKQKEAEEIEVQKRIQTFTDPLLNGDLSIEEAMSVNIDKIEGSLSNLLEDKGSKENSESDDEGDENAESENKDEPKTEDQSIEGASKAVESEKSQQPDPVDLRSRRLSQGLRRKGRLLSVIELQTRPPKSKLVKMSPRKLSVIDEILGGGWNRSKRFGKTIQVKVFKVHFSCSYDSLVTPEAAEELKAVADYQSESLINCSAKDHTMLHVIFSDKIGSEQNRFALNADSNPYIIDKHTFRVVISEPNIFPKIFTDDRLCFVHILSSVWLSRAVWASMLLLMFWDRS